MTPSIACSHGRDRFSLAGKVAVVTGASSGLGAGFATALATSGAQLVLAGRNQDRLASTKAAIDDLGGAAATVRADIANPEDCRTVAEYAISQFGRLDVLINNAGIGTAVPALRESPEEFQAVLDVNLSGAYWMAQAAARVMRPGSTIINISSVLGLMKSYAPQAAYAASKAGLIGLTRDLSQQWAGRKGIRVNAVAPGYFATELTASVPKGPLHDFIARSSPLARMGEQHELDGVIIFLASDASTYITGTTIAVDGGMSGH